MQASMKESQKLLIREKKLKKEIAYFFQKLMQRILYKLEKDWDSGILNINDYTEIVDIAHKDYFDILYTHVQREYYRARKIGENRVNRAIVKMATKADTPQINISRTDLWGTMSEVEEDLENMTFQASDKTLERVKEDKITQILHQGYVDGRNGTEVGREIKREFSKLKTYEAERIARTELHSAHEKGLLDQYKEMDVQYKQWDAHIDNRTRSSHIDLNGEITTIDGTFSNGLTRPGDKNGPIKEWIRCRCTLSPFLMPIDKMAPEGALHFRESDLVDLDFDFNIDDYTLADALSGNWNKNKSTSWEWTDEDAAKYKELKAEYRRLRKELGLRLGQKPPLSDEQEKLMRFLQDKQKFKKLYDRYIEEGLDYNDAKEIISLRKKYNWDVHFDSSKLNPISYTRKSYMTDFYGEVSSLSKKYRLTKSEEKELKELLYKRLFNQGKLNSADSSRLEFLYNKKQFNYLYSLNKQNQGLDYGAYSKYTNLFNKLKTKLNLDDDLLEIPLSNYNHGIPLDSNASKFHKWEGVSDEGLLPDGSNIDDFFTIDARNLTSREQQVADRWMGSDYRFFTDYDVKCERDINKFAELIWKTQEGEYKRYDTWEKALKLAKEIAHDTVTLDNILNNQLKRSITVYRVQEHHFLGDNPKVGDVLDFPNFRSTAVSPDGALWFSKTNSKPMKYLIEIEAPAGTKGAYLAPIKKGEIMNPESPYFGEKYAREMEFLLKKSKVEIVEFNDKTVTGAMGEELIHVKLRIIG